MIKGFSLLELIIALTVSLCILTFVLANVGDSVRHSRNIISHQQRMESLFNTVDMIRSDLTKCGMRLQYAARYFGFPLFEWSSISFKVVYGTEEEYLQEDAFKGAGLIMVNRNEFFQVKRKLIILDPETGVYETNEIKGFNANRLYLVTPLQNDFPKNSIAVVLKEVEYRHYSQQSTLKRKVDKGYFQPIVEEVTKFYVRYYPESCSVLYMIEVNNKEQVRGHIFMTNMGG